MGFSSYDKNSYRESKRRRKQAMRQSETGYIKPYRRSKKPLLVLTCAALLCVAAAVLLIWQPFAPKHSESEAAVRLTAAERLRQVNRANPMEAEEVPALTSFGQVQVHPAVADALEKMCAAAAERGVTLTVLSGYVSYEEQQKLYERNLAKYLKQKGLTPVRAQAAAQAVVPEAGSSEAQTGLYVEFDLTDARVKEFVERECINYGFIQRYPEHKEDKTHINYRANGYRYVGTEDAGKMRAFDMCLEEYDDYISSQSK